MWYFHSFPTSKLTKLRLVKSFSHVWLFAILWTVAHQAPPSMGFSRQEYWSGLTFPSPGDLPNPGIETRSPALQADLLTSEPPGKPIKVNNVYSSEDTINRLKRKTIKWERTFIACTSNKALKWITELLPTLNWTKYWKRKKKKKHFKKGRYPKSN